MPCPPLCPCSRLDVPCAISHSTAGLLEERRLEEDIAQLLQAKPCAKDVVVAPLYNEHLRALCDSERREIHDELVRVCEGGARHSCLLALLGEATAVQCTVLRQVRQEQQRRSVPDEFLCMQTVAEELSITDMVHSVADSAHVRAVQSEESNTRHTSVDEEVHARADLERLFDVQIMQLLLRR